MDNMCRICQQTGKNSPLKSMMISGLLEIYSFCTNIPITEDNEKCYKICEQCAELLVRFNNFKKLCIESDNFFKQNACVQVKLEILDDPLQYNIFYAQSKTEEDDDFMKDDYSDKDDDAVKVEFNESDNFVNNDNKDKLNKQRSIRAKASNEKSPSKSKVLTSRCCKFCLKKFKYVASLKKHYLKCVQSIDEDEKFKLPILNEEIKEECNLDDSPDRYECSTCNKGFSKKHVYKAHLRTHSEEKPYECLFCDKKYSNPHNFKLHNEKIHLKTTEYSCHFCPKTFYTTRDLRRHLTKHGILYECDLCHKKYPLKSTLITHMKNLHINNKCNICNEKFTSRIDYTNHLLTHIKDDPFKCKICESDFIYLTSFQHHVRKDHPGKRYEDCIENPQHLLLPESSHIAIPSKIKKPVKRNSRPDSEKNFICNFCGKRCKTRHSLNTHIRVHTGEKPFACDQCDKKFKDKGTLGFHRQRIHEKMPKFSCSLCSYRTYTSNQLARHTRSHFNEKPFVCNMCDASFKILGSLKIHMRSHTGERPYVCTYCNKDFTALSYLKDHLPIHTGEKRFVCKICGKKFSQRTPLAKHMEDHKNESLSIKYKAFNYGTVNY